MSKYDRMKVLARVRPLNDREKEAEEEISLHVEDDRRIHLLHQASSSRQFELDAVLEQEASQEEVFDHILPLLKTSLEGYNCTIFTYGQTGTGKTFTMLGYDLWGLALENRNTSAPPSQSRSINIIAKDEYQYGIVPRSMKWLLDDLNQKKVKFLVEVSYVELYNDVKVIDLLDQDRSNANSMDYKGLEIRENKNGEIIVPGLTRVGIQNTKEVLDVLWRGAQSRSVAATDMNDYSSRSHTVFIVYLKVENKVNEISSSKICLVDLAGSEKWRSHQLAKFNEARIAELKSINRSLSALGNCISALLKRSRVHVPYRDSKLTRLLQDSLGGNTQTLFIVTLSPSMSCVEETISTLQFADRAMKVQVSAKANKALNMPPSERDKSALESMSKELQRLKSLLQLLLKKCGATVDFSTIADEISSLGVITEPSLTKSTDCQSDNGLDFEACLSQELVDLKDEHYGLLRNLQNFQEELRIVRHEKQRILEAVFQHSECTFTHTSSNDGNMTNYHFTLRPPSNDVNKEEQANTCSKQSSDLQHQVIESLREELEARKDALDQNEDLQEERWQFLQQYHSWLQSQTAPMTKKSNEEDKKGISDDMYRRVCLMEASVLLQAEELQRTKKMFLSTNSRLQAELQTCSKLVEDFQCREHAEREKLQKLQRENEILRNTLKTRLKGDATILDDENETHENDSSSPFKPPEPQHSPSPTLREEYASLPECGSSARDISISSYHDFGSADQFLASLKLKHVGNAQLFMESYEDDSSSSASAKPSSFESPRTRKSVVRQVGRRSSDLASSPQSAFVPIEAAPRRQQPPETDKADTSSADVTDEDVAKALQLANLMIEKHKTLASNPDNHIVTGERKRLWRECYDSKYEKVYYYNRLSGETMWTMPSEYTMQLYCEDGRVVDGDGYPAKEETNSLLDDWGDDYDPTHDLDEDQLQPLDSGALDYDTAISDVTCCDFDGSKLVDSLSTGRQKLWMKGYDEEHGIEYFFNLLTKETTWAAPSENELGLYMESGSVVDENGSFVASLDDYISSRIANGYVKNAENLSVTANRRPSADLCSTNIPFQSEESTEAETMTCRKLLWRVVADSSTGDVYYYNRQTGESTWSQPSESELGLYIDCVDSGEQLVDEPNCRSGIDDGVEEDDHRRVQFKLNNVLSESCNPRSGQVDTVATLDSCNESQIGSPVSIPREIQDSPDEDADVRQSFPSSHPEESRSEDEGEQCEEQETVEERKACVRNLSFSELDTESGDKLSPTQPNRPSNRETQQEKGKARKGKAKRRKPLWREAKDATSGEVYYCNMHSRATTWTRPSDYQLSLFVENGLIVDEHGREVELEENPKKDHDTVSDMTVQDAVALADTIFERHKSKLSKQEGAEKVHSSSDGGKCIKVVECPKKRSGRSSNKSKVKRKPLWKEVTDESSGDKYYFNRQTRATTWVRPTDHELSLVLENGEIVNDEFIAE